MIYREERCLLEGDPQIKLLAVPPEPVLSSLLGRMVSDKLDPVETGGNAN